MSKITSRQRNSFRRAWHLGYMASQQGFVIEDNPYPDGSPLRLRWEQGFHYREGLREEAIETLRTEYGFTEREISRLCYNEFFAGMAI